MWCEPSSLVNSPMRSEVYCLPWSDEMVSGQLYLDTQVFMKAAAIASAEMVLVGTTSGHLENLSIKVNKYRLFFDCGRGPTISMWTCLKRDSGILKPADSGLICRVILQVPHPVHSDTHCLICFFMLGHK